MPHDGFGHHGHHHHHPHRHPHGHGASAAIGHNRPGEAEHLASHPHGGPLDGAQAQARADERQLVAEVFVDGFRAADDKTSFLRMARVPFELDAGDGPTLKLVDVEIVDGWQVGTASPGFASRELVYHPFPGNMVRPRSDMRFVYVSLTERRDLTLAEMLETIGD